ncbi:related to negative regulator of transcription [Lecanosticta acicola]|uniref:General negative regulator of transcription subunit 1 n=1 Tax=Lecanosticta acicola TaxID=111012 RepID=A0AAI8Z939_9PEZI|nr:related to negative regulator of transcription [Lecanosticta acicola]
MSQPPAHHQEASPAANDNLTSHPTARPQPSRNSSLEARQGSRRLTPITTNSASQSRSDSLAYSPSRGAFSTTHAASLASSRRVTSRPSSTSSNNSLFSPTGSAHATGHIYPIAGRPRHVAASDSPRLASSLASLSSSGGGAGGGSSSRLARRSPSLSLSNSTGSPVSSTAGSSGQLGSLVISQLNILLSTLKDDSDQVKWETQVGKIRKLVDEGGMEHFTTYFRRLLQANAPQIFPGTRAPPGTENAGSYQLLVEEVQKLAKEPQQSGKIAQALDTTEGDLFRDFDLVTFLDHFRLDPAANIALVLACRTAQKQDLRAKADMLLAESYQSLPSRIANLSHNDPESDLPASVLASIVERLMLDPPRNWGDEQRDSLFYAIKLRFNNLRMRAPAIVELAMFLDELLNSQDSRLANLVRRTGPQGTSSLQACTEMLAGVEVRDISYIQVANALLFMVIVSTGEHFDPSVFVDALRQHRAGAKIDWTDVVTGFDRENPKALKKQFLGLYNALLPLAREYANFDIQALWGGQWTYQETQLSYVVAFLTTTPEELDVMQIPNLRQSFELSDFAQASDSVRAYAEQAVKHPLVSRDATEALFTLIFKSQEWYQTAQRYGIPEDVINPNMTIFTCAASAVPKPWQPLQDQALKQLFFPFLLKRHDNYEFVMHSVWQHDKSWTATRLVEFHQSDPMLMPLILEHALAHGWLELLLTIQSMFALDLAAHAHGRGHCNLDEWAQQHINMMGPAAFARLLGDFLKSKIDDEALVQREHSNPSTVPLTVNSVRALLLLIMRLVGEEMTGPFYRQCLAIYPRLFNYGQSENIDAVIDANGEHGNVLPESATKEMEERYKEMYGGTSNPEALITELNRLKESDDPAEQDLFAAMLYGLFEEYNCFGEYPNEALATTAVLFGGLVSYRVLSDIAEQAALSMIFDAVSEYGPEDPMYRFGLQALLHVLNRLKEWPHLAERILHTPSLVDTQAEKEAEKALNELQQEHVAMNGETTNGIANGIADEEFAADATPTFTAIQIDPPTVEHFFEEPNEDISDKVTFVLNNVSKRNFDEKFKEIDEALDEKYSQWFAHYLVDELAKSQPNFQSLYLNVLEKFDKKIIWAEVLRETYISCRKMLNAQTTMENQHERTLLKNLATWLGSITLGRNQPILHRNLSFRDLLIEGYDTQRLLVVIPFTCKVLVSAKNSQVFRPPNPWIMELLGVLSELYHCMELKLNMKFEIEVLGRELDIDIHDVPTLDAIRSRPLLDQGILQNYVPEAGPDAFGDVALMGLAKRGPNERFSPDAVIQAVPDLGNLLQIPQAAGNITQQQLRNIFVSAAQQAIYEIIAPVVERSVTIASISTAELVQKDFATEGDEEKLQTSAHTVVKALSGSLALVTCKEPLRMSITNNIRILASRSLPEQLPEGQILMFVNDNIDTVCNLVERAAEDHSLAEIDLQLQQALDARRQRSEQRPNEPFAAHVPVNRWATLIPEPYRQDQNGLNRQQLALYEDFGRQARITPAVHANNVSQDSNRQLPDVLSEGYLPNLPTPAEAPAMPRPTQQRPQAMQALQNQHQVNGYMENSNINQRILELLAELSATSRDAAEEHASEVGEGSPIRRAYGTLIGLIESHPQQDSLSVNCGTHCLSIIYGGEALKRLEVEVFARLLGQLCRISVAAARHVTAQLSVVEDDRIFNAVAAVSLYYERLLEIQQIDVQVSKAIRAGRVAVALPFLRDVVDELLLSDEPVFRTDFVLSYEALATRMHQEPDTELGGEIMAKLQLPAHQVNGIPSPELDGAKTEQQEYVFEEWLRLQHKDLPLRAHLAFLRQLHDRHVISSPLDLMQFIRSALELSVVEFERASSIPYGTQDQFFIAIDALAKLLALMVLYQSAVDGDAQVDKGKPLEATLTIVLLIMNDQQAKHGDRWNSRVYFRLFSTLLCEIHDHRHQLTPEQERSIYEKFYIAMQALQPRNFPGFVHAWLALMGHRLFVPAYLGAHGRTNGGWNMFAHLLTILFENLGRLLNETDASPASQDFHRGVLRFIAVLHHDFPEFLIENHMQLDANIPPQCLQLLNIVNSAVSRGVFNDQPDPFTPGLKINRLEQVRQAPAVHCDMSNVLDVAEIKAAVDRVCTSGNDLSEQDFAAILTALTVEANSACSLTSNAVVLYIGVHATSASSVFSSAAAPARLFERLLRDGGSKIRYRLLSAMANQVRYVNAHTHYFSTALQHMFSIGSQELQEQIMRVLCERLMVPRPHPWGLIVMMLEMVKSPVYDVWSLAWVKAAPQVESMLVNLAHSQDPRMSRSPMSGIMG